MLRDFTFNLLFNDNLLCMPNKNLLFVKSISYFFYLDAEIENDEECFLIVGIGGFGFNSFLAGLTSLHLFMLSICMILLIILFIFYYELQSLFLFNDIYCNKGLGLIGFTSNVLFYF